MVTPLCDAVGAGPGSENELLRQFRETDSAEFLLW